MLAIFILGIVFLVLLFIFSNPKLGPVFLWPLLFLYPHSLMFKAALLPLNIGIDDLYICVFFLIVLFRVNILGQTRPRMGYAVWMGIIFLFILILSNANGYYVTGGVDFGPYLKRALKGFMTLLLVYSLVNTIETDQDIKRVIFSYCFVTCL